MYLLSVLLFVLISIGFLVMTSSGSIGSIACFVSPSSLILLMLISIPLLMSSGLLKDFNNAFRLSAKQAEACDRTELQRAGEAVSFAIKALWISGIFSVILTLIIIFMMEAEDPVLLIKSLSVALLPLMYAILFIILLLPVRSRLKLRLYELSAPPAPSDAKTG